MKRGQMLVPWRIGLIIAVVVLVGAALWFRSGIMRAALWESEMASVAQVTGHRGDGPRLPHLEYQSPAYQAALAAAGVTPSGILRARNVSWICAVGTVAALIAAGWMLFSPMEGLMAGFIAAGSLRMLQAAHTAVPDPFLMLWLALTAAFMGLALRSSSWLVWIALGGTCIMATLSGFQAVPAVISVAAVGAVLISQQTRRDGSEVRTPVWQYVATVPVAVTVCAFWAVTWVLTSRQANPPIARPPLMNPRYLSFVIDYLFGHAPWAGRLLGVAAVVGIVGSLRKRIVKVEDLRRVYVDKRSRRPMVFLLLWFVVGIPALNLLQFNARRPQDPAVINTLFIPLALVAARGMVLCAEGIVVGLQRVAGARVNVLPIVLMLGITVGWFAQGSARQTYAGYRFSITGEDSWAQAASYLAPRSVLARAVMVTPPWAARLIKAHLGAALGDATVTVPVLGGQVDSLVRASPASWAVLYQSDLYPHVPDRVRRSLDQQFEEIRRFPTTWGGTIVILATSWLQASESQWNFEQERLAMGGEEADQALIAMARMYVAAGRSDSARAALGRVLTHDTTNVEALLEMALLVERAGDNDDALVWYRRAARSDTTDPRPFYEQGRILTGLGRLPAASTSLERALGLDSRHVQAAQLLAGVYRELGKDDKARMMDERLEDMGGKVMVDYDYGRLIGVRSVELPTTTWRPGEETAVVVSWVTVGSSAAPIAPTLTVYSSKSTPMLRPPPGGWTLTLPDSGFAAGVRGSDTLNVHFLYRDVPQTYPDDVELRLNMVDAAGALMSVSNSHGEQLQDAPVGHIVAWRASGQRRVSVEAEEMEQHPGFAVPGGINVTDAGLLHSFRLPGGPVSFEIVARGTPAAGQWPRMVIEVAGQVVRELDVADREWRTYMASISSIPGVKAFRIRFPNDYVNPATGEDRNLVIDRVTMIEEEIRFRFETP